MAALANAHFVGLMAPLTQQCTFERGGARAIADSVCHVAWLHVCGWTNKVHLCAAVPRGCAALLSSTYSAALWLIALLGGMMK